MAEKEDLSALRNKVEELEARLGLPQKLTLSKEAATSGEARKKALQLPDSGKSQNLAAAISALADQNNVVVEWSAREILSSTLARSIRCCCCCCCCIVTTSW